MSFLPGWFQFTSSGAGWLAADWVLPQPGSRVRLLSHLRHLAVYLLSPLSHGLASFAAPEGSLLTWSFPRTTTPITHTILCTIAWERLSAPGASCPSSKDKASPWPLLLPSCTLAKEHSRPHAINGKQTTYKWVWPFTAGNY